MFNNDLKGGVENGINYLERIIDLIRKIFAMLFGSSTDTTEPASVDAE